VGVEAYYPYCSHSTTETFSILSSDRGSGSNLVQNGNQVI